MDKMNRILEGKIKFPLGAINALKRIGNPFNKNIIESLIFSISVVDYIVEVMSNGYKLAWIDKDGNVKKFENINKEEKIAEYYICSRCNGMGRSKIEDPKFYWQTEKCPGCNGMGVIKKMI